MAMGPMMAWVKSPTGPMTTHFWGPIANWGLSLSGIYDATCAGPEIINERMSATQVVYSGLFVRFAWQVEPRNMILFWCHSANVFSQLNQLRRWVQYELEEKPDEAPERIKKLAMGAAGAGGALGAVLAVRKPLMSGIGNASFLPTKFRSFATHPAGPFFIHFWAPNFKWALSINNLLDYNRPVERISLSMNTALTLTGVLFMRWSFLITPVNYSLFFVNCALASSSGYHLARKVKADYIDKK